MKTPEEIFEKATQYYGGRVDDQPQYLENHKIRFNSFLNNYRKDKRLLKPFPNVICDFVKSDLFNAFALKYNENYIIGIHEAVRLILFDLFNRMLSHREIFNEVGDFNNELEYTEKIEDYFADLKSLVVKGHNNNNYKFKHPINRSRQLYAEHLTTIAMDFIFEHELSHILFGHVDYLNDTFQINVLSEFQSSSNQKLLLLDLQTLEMDADCTALARCCSWAIAVVKKPDRVNSDLHQFYTDYYYALSDVFFAIYNTMRIFGDGDYKNMTPGKSSHPDTRIRQLMFLGTFEPIIKINLIEIEYKKLYDLLLDRIVISEKAYKLLTGNEINKEVFHPEYLAHNPLPKALEDNWKNNIRDKLLKYTFKPLAE